MPYPFCFWAPRPLQPEPQAALRLKVFGDLDCHLSAFGRGVSWLGPELCRSIARGTQPRKVEPVLSVYRRDNWGVNFRQHTGRVRVQKEATPSNEAGMTYEPATHTLGSPFRKGLASPTQGLPIQPCHSFSPHQSCATLSLPPWLKCLLLAPRETVARLKNRSPLQVSMAFCNDECEHSRVQDLS